MWNLALIGRVVSEKKIMVIYMYTAPGQRQKTPELNCFHEQYYSVNKVLCCKFFSIK